MKTLPIEHQLSEVWREHVQETLRVITGVDHRIARLKAAVYEAEREIVGYREHLRMLVGQLVKEAGLPEGPYSLSADGARITGTVTVEDQ